MRIGIANDMPLAVEAIRRALAREASHSIAWVAGNGVEAVRNCLADRPDIVLMDLLMPEMSGVEAIRQITAQSPCAILIVTSDIDRNMGQMFEAMGNGAMDVVRTPTLGGDAASDATMLLHKIDTIAWMIGHRVVRRPPAVARRCPATDLPPLVAIGASAGGPIALDTVLKQLPKGFRAAVVLIQHVDSVFASDLAEWLGQGSPLPVGLARQGDAPRAGEVLLAGTNDHLKVGEGGLLNYSVEPKNLFYKPSVDVFFDSIVEGWSGEAVGVVLTGMGHDGASGLKHMRDRGFLTIAQDRATSAVYGMPKAAFEAGAATEILPLTRIATRLCEAMA